jgi:hypothetical protein
MAIVRDNIIMEGVRGMLGGVVFRNIRGKTIMSNKPKPPSRQSQEQRANRDRFRNATIYAKAMMHDPLKKEYYRRKAVKLALPNAYTAAITDYMRRITITDIVTKETKTGTDIVFTARKQDFTINCLTIKALNAAGIDTPSSNATRLYGAVWKLSIAKLPEGTALQFMMTDDTGVTSRYRFLGNRSLVNENITKLATAQNPNERLRSALYA